MVASASAQHIVPARRCSEPGSIAQRRTALAADDQREIDRAVAEARTRAHLSEMTAPGRDRSGEGDDGLPASPALPPGQTARTARPLDPADVNGASIETRRAADGSVHVYLVQPAQVSSACGAFVDRPDDFRFARAADGRVVPLRIVFRDVVVPGVQCGCVGGGCGHAHPPMTRVHEFELPVHDASEVAMPLALRIVRHVLQVGGSQRCPPVP